MFVLLFYFLEKMCRECFRRLAVCKCDKCDVIMCQGCFDKVMYFFLKRKKMFWNNGGNWVGGGRHLNFFQNWKKNFVTRNENTQKVLLNFLKQLKQKTLNLFHGISFFVFIWCRFTPSQTPWDNTKHCLWRVKRGKDFLLGEKLSIAYLISKIQMSGDGNCTPFKNIWASIF